MWSRAHEAGKVTLRMADISYAMPLNRRALLRRGVGGGATVLGLSAFAGRASAAGIPDEDLSYLRLLVGGELLKLDFATQALASRKLNAATARLLRRLRADDTAHYSGLAALLSNAGQSPAGPGDIDFSYPRGSFASQEQITRLAWQLTTLALGAYVGAVGSVQTDSIRLPLAQISANEAQQAGALAPFVGRPQIGAAFAPALPIDTVSAALDEFES
jgi:hypothetical protein